MENNLNSEDLAYIESVLSSVKDRQVSNQFLLNLEGFYPRTSSDGKLLELTVNVIVDFNYDKTYPVLSGGSILGTHVSYTFRPTENLENQISELSDMTGGTFQAIMPTPIIYMEATYLCGCMRSWNGGTCGLPETCWNHDYAPQGTPVNQNPDIEERLKIKHRLKELGLTDSIAAIADYARRPWYYEKRYAK